MFINSQSVIHFGFSFSGDLTVRRLANLIDEKPVAVIKFLMTDLGVMASLTQTLDPVTCVAVVEGFGKLAGWQETGEEL